MAVPAASSFSPIGPQGGFIPGYDPDARARLIVNYARNPKDFTLNRWVHIHPVTKIKGIYPKILAQDAIRVPHADMSDLIWPDGVPAPVGTSHVQGTRLTNITYELVRYKKDVNVGHIARDQSEFDLIKLEQNRLASVMMTARTIMCLTAALDTANYPTDHTGTATAIGGGLWTAGTLNSPYIKQSLDTIRDRVLLDTNAKVEILDLQLVLSPTLAAGMARSQEIRVYLAQQGNSLGVIKGDSPDAKDNWTLPNPLYGFNVVIERTPKVTTKPTANATGSTDGTPVYCMDAAKALIVSRPGKLVSDDGGINFSTIHLLEMKGEAFKTFMKDTGDQDKLTYIRLEDFFTVIVPAPESGYVVTGCA